MMLFSPDSSGRRSGARRLADSEIDNRGIMMRRVAVLALLLLVIIDVPVRADELDSENQMQQYRGIFGWACGGIAALTLLLGGYLVFKGFIAEAARGKKKLEWMQKILEEEAPKTAQKDRYMGEKVPEWKIDNRTKATKAALKFLACTDNRWSLKHITAVSSQIFKLARKSLEVRSTKKLTPFVNEDTLEKLQAEVKKLVKKGQFHVFGKLEVTDVTVVHFEAPVGKNNHTFTALITAKSKDFFEDEESGEVLRGDKKTYHYQEFWKFRRTKPRWIVERIRSAGDMDRVLESKNVMAAVDLEEFSKDLDEEFTREFVAK